MLNMLIFLFLSIAIILYFKNDFITWITASKEKERKTMQKTITTKQYIDKINGQEKISYLSRNINNVKEVLQQTQTENRFSGIMRMSTICAVVGMIIGLLLKNVFLAATLACGLYFIPMWAVKFKLYAYRKIVGDELEIALGLITTAYIRNNDLVKSVSENIENINYPIKQIFIGFLNSIRYVNSNVGQELDKMKLAIDNNLFKEWCELAILCQNDHTLKHILVPIVNKFSDLKAQQNENETNMMLPIRNAVKMVTMVIIIVPLLYFFDSTWFYSFWGQLALAATAIVIFWTINDAIKLSSPIEYNV